MKTVHELLELAETLSKSSRIYEKLAADTEPETPLGSAISAMSSSIGVVLESVSQIATTAARGLSEADARITELEKAVKRLSAQGGNVF